jgi:hypothetical protein
MILQRFESSSFSAGAVGCLPWAVILLPSFPHSHHLDMQFTSAKILLAAPLPARSIHTAAYRSHTSSSTLSVLQDHHITLAPIRGILPRVPATPHTAYLDVKLQTRYITVCRSAASLRSCTRRKHKKCMVSGLELCTKGPRLAKQ